MKLRKVLALILAVVMCVSVCAVFPVVSAATPEDSLWEPLQQDGWKGDDGKTAADEGWEHIYLDGNKKSHQVTKEEYDMTETTLSIRNLYTNTNGDDWVNIVFAPEAKGRLTQSAPTDGIFSIFVRKTANGYKVSYWGTNEQQLALLEPADELEIGFIYSAGAYRLRLNNTYVYNDNITQFCESGFMSYISLSTYNTYGGDFKIINNDSTYSRWVATYRKNNKGSNLKNMDGTAVTDNAATSFKIADSNNGVISSLAKYNMLENTLVLSNVVPDAVASNWTELTFSTERKVVLSKDDDTTVSLFLRPTYADGKVTQFTYKTCTNGADNGTSGTIPAADKYEITFRAINNQCYIYINETRINTTHYDAIFTNENIKGLYITFYAAKTFAADMKVVSHDEYKDKFINPTTGAVAQAPMTVYNKNYASSYTSHDLLRGKLTLKDCVITGTSTAENSGSGIVAIGDVSLGGWGGKPFSGKYLLNLLLYANEVVDGKVTKYNVKLYRCDNWNGGSIGVIPAANDYTFNFAKEGNNYYLYINGQKMNDFQGYITAMGKSGSFEKSYVTLGALGPTMTATPVFTESTWEQVGKVEDANWTSSLTNENAAENVSAAHDSYIRFKDKFDIRTSSVVIDNLAIADYADSADQDLNGFDKAAMLIFAKSDKVTGPVVASENGLTFAFLSVKNDTENLIKVFNCNSKGVWENLGTVNAADSYNISVVYSIANNNYSLMINETALSMIDGNAGIKFFENGGNDIYVLFGANQTTVTADKVEVPEVTDVLGDVNDDGERDIVDMVMVERGLAEGNSNAAEVDVIRKTWFANGFNFVQ